LPVEDEGRPFRHDRAPPDIPSFEGPGWMAQVIFDI